MTTNTTRDAQRINGMRILVNDLAVDYKKWFTVERAHGRPKRRKGYLVVRHEESKPGAYQIGNHTLVLHPAVYEQLKGAL